jgi:hypothetical protein
MTRGRCLFWLQINKMSFMRMSLVDQVEPSQPAAAAVQQPPHSDFAFCLQLL